MVFWSDVYPPHIKPVREGRYLTCRGEPSGAMSLQIVHQWDGIVWRTERGMICLDQDRHWRGLAFDPTGAAPETDAETGLRGAFIPGATCC